MSNRILIKKNTTKYSSNTNTKKQQTTKGVMIEILILRYLLNSENYTKYRHYIKIKENRELEALYKILDVMIGSYGRSITFDEFEATVLQQDPSLGFLLERVKEVEIGDDVLVDLIRSSQERSWAHEHALLSIAVSEGSKPLQNLLEHYSEIEDRTIVDETTFVTDDLEEIYESSIKTPGLRWRLNCLNKAIGSLRKGNFVTFFSRPESGKTTMLASEVTHMAGQTDNSILWFNNEQEGSAVKIRCYQAALGCDLVKLFSDRDRSQKYYFKATKGNIKVFDDAAIHKKQVERMCKEFSPSLIVFDQIDKIKGFNDDREDLRLGAIYIWARELAKQYAPVIGICQADGSAEGKKWLDMGNMANSKTSKAAEADVIIGMGSIPDVGLEHIRYLNIIKNKLTGDSDSDPTMRHAKIEVIIEPNIARFKEFN